ncbi:RNA polymerase sigma factor [Alicyclobacillus macrosporangiidus]|uniref:RNA polymerase sigma-70 factor, ECF subfamily n=1 Tax=Alicyclobacillus macrosporangiidus TaxID=392015 RepID=A0A1I7F2X0_9BACL|nr:RNA polymerase sigma factor [Alicyclobacillus macrosporangiidus]SFU30517.1 RNA polymerase sigma-70 factor, ECF subfamily [Alicyclobacillus macrosporangiidus]
MDDELDVQRSIEALFRLHKDELYRHVLFVLGNPTDAEDVVAEVFMKVVRSWHTFRRDSSARTWIWSICRNCISDHIQKRRRTQPPRDDGESMVYPADVMCLFSMVEWDDIIQKLPLDQRRVISLRVVEGYSTRETAVLLGWTEPKVRMVLYRAKNKLRKLLSDHAPIENHGFHEEDNPHEA